ncbi:hypothetical protein HF086_003136 [Spodoptera exigua]|uniref:Uncharacterized protein n=1 Tax=Spodoptera exigua TaxID=7107 RepID=A0A922MX59_SPOEX|nr:hypothetical protein HF086_003136 [Spodoptera exigua]
MAFRGFSTYLDLYVALRNHKDLRDYDHLFDTLKSNTNVQLSESDSRQNNEKFAGKVLNVLETKKNPPLREVPTHKALALYVYLQLSKWRYITLRDFSLKEGHAKYPSYYLLVKEKLKCYPAKEDITVTETSAKIRIQTLLDLTVRRLIDSLESNFDAGEQLVLHSKWGFDGASSQSIYHQTTTTSEQDLSSVFMASLVPLKLVTFSGSIVWQNDRPSSTTCCRPISFTFMKETEANVKAEEIFETEIRERNPTDCGDATVTHNLWLTMIDGKVHSIISGTSAAVCDLCKARPSEMNNLEEVRAKPVNTDVYKHGFSSLHAWSRSMECLLHISYRMDTKSWQAKGDESKKIS